MNERERLNSLHTELCETGFKTMVCKNHDYTGEDDDPYLNFRQSELFGIHPAVGIMLRMGDKMQRIKTFATRGELKVDGEGLRDAVIDIINYAVLAYGLLTEKQEHGEDDNANLQEMYDKHREVSISVKPFGFEPPPNCS